MLLFLVVKSGVESFHRIVVGQLAGHEATVTRLLHYLGATVARQFDETVVTVDGRVVDDTSVAQYETAICYDNRAKVNQITAKCC